MPSQKRDPNYIEKDLNQLVQVNFSNQKRQPGPAYEKFWLPTPETCSSPENLQSLQRENLDQIKNFRLEKIHQKNDCEQKEKFLQNFKWENSAPTSEHKVKVEKFLVKFSGVLE